MDPREIFERAGTALLTGASLEGLPKIGRRAARLAIEEAIEALDAAALVGALHGVSDITVEDEAVKAAALEEAEEEMQARDRVQIMIIGHRALLGEEPRLGQRARRRLEEFDKRIAAELWRAVAMGDRREAAVSWVLPEFRPAFWWRMAGMGIGPNAIAAFYDVAQVLGEFPEAWQFLVELVRAEWLMQQALAIRRSREG